MDNLKSIYTRAAKRHGGPKAFESTLSAPKSRAALRRLRDDRVLAEMTKWLFRAGFVWRVIDAKWDGFEAAFADFDPQKCARLSERKLAGLAADTRIVRNPQKIRAVRDNARLVVEIAGEHGSVGRFLAAWPREDIVGLWTFFKTRGGRLGGNTGQYFLRHLGVDTPILSADVVKALRAEGVVETASPTSKKALREIQAAFDVWAAESGRSFTEISRILACSVE